MLEKKYRITKNKEFAAVSGSKKSVYNPYCILKFITNDLNYSRFGLIVSNKVSKKATQRSLIKRRVRAIIEKNFNKIKPSYDIVFIISPKVINQQAKVLQTSELEPIIISSFSKAKLI